MPARTVHLESIPGNTGWSSFCLIINSPLILTYYVIFVWGCSLWRPGERAVKMIAAASDPAWRGLLIWARTNRDHSWTGIIFYLKVLARSCFQRNPAIFRFYKILGLALVNRIHEHHNLRWQNRVDCTGGTRKSQLSWYEFGWSGQKFLLLYSFRRMISHRNNDNLCVFLPARLLLSA